MGTSRTTTRKLPTSLLPGQSQRGLSAVNRTVTRNKSASLRMVGPGSGYRHTMVSPLAEFLCPPGFAGPSGLRAIAREGSALSEAARFVRRSRDDRHRRDAQPWAARTAARDLQPVVLVPGFMAGDASLALMARHLREVGHRTYRSRMHANVGCTQAAGESLERRIEASRSSATARSPSSATASAACWPAASRPAGPTSSTASSPSAARSSRRAPPTSCCCGTSRC